MENQLPQPDQPLDRHIIHLSVFSMLDQSLQPKLRLMLLYVGIQLAEDTFYHVFIFKIYEESTTSTKIMHVLETAIW